MNNWIGMGRLTRDPELRYAQGSEQMAITRYTMAVDRRRKVEGQQTADFINVVAFGKSAEFANKYFKKGTKIVVSGRIQSGSYTNKDGVTIYTTEIVAEDQEFAESKGSTTDSETPRNENASDGFANIPDGLDTDLPFAPPTR